MVQQAGDKRQQGACSFHAGYLRLQTHTLGVCNTAILLQQCLHNAPHCQVASCYDQQQHQPRRDLQTGGRCRLQNEIKQQTIIKLKYRMQLLDFNTFTAIVDLSRFNNSCLKSPTSTLVALTFQSRSLRSFSLNQLRNLSLQAGNLHSSFSISS